MAEFSKPLETLAFVLEVFSTGIFAQDEHGGYDSEGNSPDSYSGSYDSSGDTYDYEASYDFGDGYDLGEVLYSDEYSYEFEETYDYNVEFFDETYDPDPDGDVITSFDERTPRTIYWQRFDTWEGAWVQESDVITTNEFLADTDGDGVDDLIEWGLYFLYSEPPFRILPTDPTDLAADWDQEGWDQFLEFFWLNSDPTDPNDPPFIDDHDSHNLSRPNHASAEGSIGNAGFLENHEWNSDQLSQILGNVSTIYSGTGAGTGTGGGTGTCGGNGTGGSSGTGGDSGTGQPPSPILPSSDHGLPENTWFEARGGNIAWGAVGKNNPAEIHHNFSGNSQQSNSGYWAGHVGLKGLIDKLHGDYPGKMWLFAHSMGGIVASEALRSGGLSKIHTYAACQTAVVGHAYDETHSHKGKVWLPHLGTAGKSPYTPPCLNPTSSSQFHGLGLNSK